MSVKFAESDVWK